MAQTVAKSKRPVATKKQSSVDKMKDFLEKQFPHELDQRLVVHALWANKFRINVYKTVRSKNAVMTHNELSSSAFVVVIEKNGKLSYVVK